MKTMKNCYVLEIPDSPERMPQGAIADLTNLGEMVPGTMTITRIHVPPAHRGMGYGAQLLRQIVSDADEVGILLSLEINPYGPLDYQDLENWYIRYGFFLHPSVGIYVRIPGAPVRPLRSPS